MASQTQPVARCFVTVCFGAAFLLVFIQQQSWMLQPIAQTETPLMTSIAALPPPDQPPLSDSDVSPPLPVPVDSPELVVSLSDRQVHVYRDGKLKASYDVAVGHPEWPTPTGRFQVQYMQKDPTWLHPITKEIVTPGPGNPLGSRWIGFWAKDGWQIGFHGTNEVESIGQAVSHGCIRMYESDIQKLYEQVQPGTVVRIEA